MHTHRTDKADRELVAMPEQRAGAELEFNTEHTAYKLNKQNEKSNSDSFKRNDFRHHIQFYRFSRIFAFLCAVARVTPDNLSRMGFASKCTCHWSNPVKCAFQMPERGSALFLSFYVYVRTEREALRIRYAIIIHRESRYY